MESSAQSFQEAARKHVEIRSALKAAEEESRSAIRKEQLLMENLKESAKALAVFITEAVPSRCAVINGDVLTIEFGNNLEHTRIKMFGANGRPI